MIKEGLRIRSDLLSNWLACFLAAIVWALVLVAFFKNPHDNFGPFTVVSLAFLGILCWLQSFEISFQEQDLQVRIPFKKTLIVSYDDIRFVKFMIADAGERKRTGPLFRLVIERTNADPITMNAKPFSKPALQMMAYNFLQRLNRDKVDTSIADWSKGKFKSLSLNNHQRGQVLFILFVILVVSALYKGLMHQ